MYIFIVFVCNFLIIYLFLTLSRIISNTTTMLNLNIPIRSDATIIAKSSSELKKFRTIGIGNK